MSEETKVTKYGVFGGYGGGPCGYEDLLLYSSYDTAQQAFVKMRQLQEERTPLSFYVAEIVVCKCCGNLIKEGKSVVEREELK